MELYNVLVGGEQKKSLGAACSLVVALWRSGTNILQFHDFRKVLFKTQWNYNVLGDLTLMNINTKSLFSIE